MLWLVTYTLDEGATRQEVKVAAADYSEAYTKVIFDYPMNVIIIEVKEI
jgi:ribosomal protein L18E